MGVRCSVVDFLYKQVVFLLRWNDHKNRNIKIKGDNVKRFCLSMVFLVVLLTILVACTPKATPAPATPPGKATNQPTVTSATPSPSDANWQKAVQALGI
ncbi:MAG: hypothetical protein HW384_2293 [Dehalococcoidia bacterium]|nr:hypothetical protein [Dehalococcoidia bacterium]